MTHPQYPDAPWIRADLSLPARTLAEIEAQAVASFPSECCGFLFGPAGDVGVLDVAQPETNLADKYHAMDPESFPRTSKTYFKINEMRAARAVEQGATEGRPLKVIYHSHCDAGAYFSEEDAATFSQGGLLMWPCAFLVVSVMDGKVAEHRLWQHVPGTDRFEEGTLNIVD